MLVPCARLDELLGRMHVDMVKIDTQGADHEVIAGMAGLVDTNPSIVTLTEFWLEGLEVRNVDPREVLRDYRAQGFAVGLLDANGAAQAATDDEIVAACESWGGRYTNLVLEGPRGRRVIA